MPKLLILTGDLAAGKSTFADVLSKRYGVTCVQKDPIKEILGDTIGFTGRAENLKLSGAAMQLMAFAFRCSAAAGQDLILEANFRRPDLEALYAIAEEYGVSLLTVKITARMDIIYERYLHRMNHENRHPVHLSTPFETIEPFAEYIEGIRAVPLDGEVIEICADDFAYRSDEKLLARLDAFMKG